LLIEVLVEVLIEGGANEDCLHFPKRGGQAILGSRLLRFNRTEHLECSLFVFGIPFVMKRATGKQAGNAISSRMLSEWQSSITIPRHIS
jgi:hypothetical protein